MVHGGSCRIYPNPRLLFHRKLDNGVIHHLKEPAVLWQHHSGIPSTSIWQNCRFVVRFVAKSLKEVMRLERPSRMPFLLTHGGLIRYLLMIANKGRPKSGIFLHDDIYRYVQYDNVYRY